MKLNVTAMSNPYLKEYRDRLVSALTHHQQRVASLKTRIDHLDDVIAGREERLRPSILNEVNEMRAKLPPEKFHADPDK